MCGAFVSAKTSQLLLLKPCAEIPALSNVKMAMGLGVLFSAGLLPAENALNFPLPMWLSKASAKMLRAVLWVQRKSTFNGLASVTLDSFALTSFTNSFGVDFARLPLATVLGQVRQHSIHAVELGSIN